MQDKQFWKASWWRQKERARWALTLALAAALVGGGVLLDREQARQEAAESAAQLAEEQRSREAERLAAALLAREEAEQQAQAEHREQAGEAEGSSSSAPEEAPPPSQPEQAQEPAYGEDGQPQSRLEPEALRVSAGALELVMPVNGSVLRGQGYDYDPTTEDYRFHRGIDLSAAAGDPVFCAAAGKVTAATEDAFWGGIVVVEHGGGWSSAYRGLEPAVEAGQQVEAGSLLGQVLSTIPAEAVQESHVHVELSLDGDSVDPSAWL